MNVSFSFLKPDTCFHFGNDQLSVASCRIGFDHIDGFHSVTNSIPSRHFDVDSTSLRDVESTSKRSWIWKSDRRHVLDVVSTA